MQRFLDFRLPHGTSLSLRGHAAWTAAGILFALAGVWGTPAMASPVDAENYRLERGGVVDLLPESYLEGSWRAGGIQPDYFLDPGADEFGPLMNYARSLNTPAIPTWDRIRAVVRAVQRTFPYRAYRSPRHLRLNHWYTSRSRTVPLSRYARCGAGVCREHALVTHFALKEAGVPNLYAYVRVFTGGRSEYLEQDHAISVILHEGEY